MVGLGLGGVALLEEVCPWGWVGLEVSKALARQSLSWLMDQDVVL